MVSEFSGKKSAALAPLLVFRSPTMSKRIIPRTLCSIIIALASLGMFGAVEAAGNIDATYKWAWATNVGWLNFDPASGGVTVCGDHLQGYAWGENIGWIRLGTFSDCAAHTYSNTTSTDYGVNKDSSGRLSGYAWGTNVGWIKFDPTDGGVTISPFTGSFEGYAWGENIGWIHFKSTGAIPYNVVEVLFRVFSPLLMK